MWQLMVARGQQRHGQTVDKEVVAKALQSYDKLWEEWRALKEKSRWCATLYTDRDFRGRKDGSIGELAEWWREQLTSKAQ